MQFRPDMVAEVADAYGVIGNITVWGNGSKWDFRS